MLWHVNAGMELSLHTVYDWHTKLSAESEWLFEGQEPSAAGVLGEGSDAHPPQRPRPPRHPGGRLPPSLLQETKEIIQTFQGGYP